MPHLQVVVALLVAVQAITIASAVPVIQAPWGTIQGLEVEGDAGRKMNGYLGIRYALPPVGKLRWEKPQPHPGPGEGKVFKADTEIPACMQHRPGLIESTREMGEDCLMLNVYVPTGAQNSASLYPVMFFIHGGGLTMGDTTFYRPSKLVVDAKVIMVTVQYRLGSFGFFYSGDGVLPGNQGFWDQNLALHWVKDNIRAFGGDPDLITVFGESAGSWSTGVQMMSPHSKGLIKRAILQSGAPHTVSDSKFYQKNKVLEWTAEQFGCQRETTAELVKCFRNVPADEFFNKTMQLSPGSPAGSFFVPLVDGEFIPRALTELIMDEQYVQENGIGDIDVIMGFNNREGALAQLMLMFFQQPKENLYTPQFFRSCMNMCFVFLGLTPNEVLKKSVEFFYRGADMDANQTMTADTVADMYGDCLMNAPILEWSRYLAASPHTSNRYLYVLDHPFAFNAQSVYPGSHHADELLLEFDNEREFEDNFLLKKFNTTALAADEVPLAKKFIQIITTFAKTGNPSAPVRDDLGGDWPEFTVENQAYLSISNTPRVVLNAGPYRDSAALWNNLLPALDTLTSQRATDAEDEEEAKGKDEL
ncbi:acetylcholinesterase-like isoform X2 [Littorina saxatilis]|uniref:Carboxylic ester hydrolase n=1 Tax=Littorina saxatilis TaxID=31220 RepID=A0AAN9BFC7_9CAEN